MGGGKISPSKLLLWYFNQRITMEKLEKVVRKKAIWNKLMGAGLLGLVFIFAGCSQNLARFSVATTSNLPMTDLTKGEYVKGKDCIFTFLWWGFGNTSNRVSGAVAKALEVSAKKGGPSDALVNVDISESSWQFIIGRNCIWAKGQAIELNK